jgi:hypothetical protein
MSLPLDEAAARLVADLMPIAITIAEPGGTNQAAVFAAALERAGAAADLFKSELASGSTGQGTNPAYDLAILLTGAEPLRASTVSALIESLAAVSDRLLFIPHPDTNPDLDAWFELFAEQGYQPVVDYDASFLGQGAFLVDRNAIAAETDLSAFAERINLGGALAASTQRVASLEAELGTAGDREKLKAELAAAQTRLSAAAARENDLRARAEGAESELIRLREQVEGWHGMAKALGAWIATVCASPSRNDLATLRAASGHKPRRGLLTRMRCRAPGPGSVERQHLADASLIRASPLFDAGWYIACHTELADTGADPVWHYVLRGAPAGADPGPYFDTAAYRAAHPDLGGNPLAQAIRHGHVKNEV